jgi:hypothetical protein
VSGGKWVEHLRWRPSVIFRVLDLVLISIECEVPEWLTVCVSTRFFEFFPSTY